MATESPSAAAVLGRLRPLVERAAEGAIERDLARELPRDAVRELATAGVGALRVPEEHGGAGLSIPELVGVLIELAAADANLPQILRGHLALVEDVLVSPDAPRRARWLDRIVAGELVGNAWSETTNTVGSVSTRLSRTDDGWRIDGRKFYTTGSIFADWIDATATGPDGEELVALVRTAQPGVTVADDWDGFGQRTTGTGGLELDGAAVERGEVTAFDARFRYQTAFYQTVLLAVLAGIASAVERDAAAALAARSRVYSHGSAAEARHDPQLLAVVGEVAAAAFTARATTLAAAEAVQRAADAAADPAIPRDSEADRVVNAEAELATAAAQTVLVRLVPDAATRLFDALGASGVSESADLDRHWRNARTVASHNPVLFKTRILGDHRVNGTLPRPLWSVGASRSAGNR